MNRIFTTKLAICDLFLGVLQPAGNDRNAFDGEWTFWLFDIKEGGIPVDVGEGVRLKDGNNKASVFALHSGTYALTCTEQ